MKKVERNQSKMQEQLQPGQVSMPISEGPQFIVQKIVADCVKQNKMYYLLKWQGYSHQQNTWEPIEHLQNAIMILNDWLVTKQNQRKKISSGKKRGRPKKCQTYQETSTQNQIQYSKIQAKSQNKIICPQKSQNLVENSNQNQIQTLNYESSFRQNQLQIQQKCQKVQTTKH